MKIEYKQAVIEDAELLVNIYNDTELYITERVNNILFKKILLTG